MQHELTALERATVILDVISSHYRVEPRRLKSRQRDQHIAMVRMIALHLTRKLTDLSFPSIGDLYNRDHSTVIHAWQLIARRQVEQPGFAIVISDLVKKVNGAMEEALRKAAGIAA